MDAQNNAPQAIRYARPEYLFSSHVGLPREPAYEPRAVIAKVTFGRSFTAA